MSTKTITLTESLHHYLLSVSLREPPILARLREETAQHPLANMQIAPEQGQFMALLVRLMGVKSTLSLGSLLATVPSLSPWLCLPTASSSPAMSMRSGPLWRGVTGKKRG